MATELDDQLQALITDKRDFDPGSDDVNDPPAETLMPVTQFKQVVTANQLARATWELLTGQPHEDIEGAAVQPALLKVESAVPDSRDAPETGSFHIFSNPAIGDNGVQIGWGNPYVAGVGIPAIGLWTRYRDEEDAWGDWRLFASWEDSGTLSPVLDGIRRSAVEVHLQNGDYKPLARIFEASSQAMQIGAGGFVVAVGDAVRVGGVLTLSTSEVIDRVTGDPVRQEHRMAVGQKLYKSSIAGSSGNPVQFGVGEFWGPGSVPLPGGTERFINSVIDPYTITVLDARSDFTNTEPLNFSTEPSGDVEYGRGAPFVAEIRAKGATRLKVVEAGPLVPFGQSLRGEAEQVEDADPGQLLLGADGVDSTGVTSAELVILEGKALRNKGQYFCLLWDNTGGQTQETQEQFVVYTGASDKHTYLAPIAGRTGLVQRIKNDPQGTANKLTVHSDSGAGDTINGSGNDAIILGPGDAVLLIAVGTNWQVHWMRAGSARPNTLVWAEGLIGGPVSFGMDQERVVFINPSMQNATVTFGLPSANGLAGERIFFKRIGGGANALIIECPGGDYLEGALAGTIAMPNWGDSLEIISDGDNWWKTGGGSI